MALSPARVAQQVFDARADRGFLRPVVERSARAIALGALAALFVAPECAAETAASPPGERLLQEVGRNEIENRNVGADIPQLAQQGLANGGSRIIPLLPAIAPQGPPMSQQETKAEGQHVRERGGKHLIEDWVQALAPLVVYFVGGFLIGGNFLRLGEKRKGSSKEAA